MGLSTARWGFSREKLATDSSSTILVTRAPRFLCKVARACL